MPQLFTPVHYQTFDPPKPDMDDDLVRLERRNVQDQFLWLNDSLAPFIKSNNWDLHPHHQKAHLTSSTHFVWINTGTGEVDDNGQGPGHWQPIVNHIGWLWLHYGKSKEQLNFYKNLPGVFAFTQRDDSDYYNAFYVHTRIQLYLSDEIFGVWLLQTDKDRFDRSEFLKGLRTSTIQQEFIHRLRPLYDKDFCFVTEAGEFQLKNGLDEAALLKFIKAGRSDYTGIRKVYQPDNPRLDVLNIMPEMQENLELLYPLYDMMAFRQKPVAPDLTGLFGGNARVR